MQLVDRRQTLLRRFVRYPLTRLLVGIVAVGLAMAAGNLVLSLGRIQAGWGRPIVTIVAVHVAYFLFVRLYERRSVVELDRWAAGRGLVLGIAGGVALVATVVAVTWAAGGYEVDSGRGAHGLPAAFLSVAAVAYAEEILFRGIVYRLVEEAGGTWLALAVSAVTFGSIHLANPGATVVSTGALALEAGILLGAIFALTRRLWVPIGVHLGWNFGVGSIFGLAVSGNRSIGLVDAHLVGPTWLTGGAFGIEASAAAVVICCAVATLVLYLAYRRGRIVAAPWRRGR